MLAARAVARAVRTPHGARAITTGTTIPDAGMKLVQGEAVSDVSAKEWFAGKKVRHTSHHARVLDVLVCAHFAGCAGGHPRGFHWHLLWYAHP